MNFDYSIVGEEIPIADDLIFDELSLLLFGFLPILVDIGIRYQSTHKHSATISIHYLTVLVHHSQIDLGNMAARLHSPDDNIIKEFPSQNRRDRRLSNRRVVFVLVEVILILLLGRGIRGLQLDYLLGDRGDVRPVVGGAVVGPVRVGDPRFDVVPADPTTNLSLIMGISNLSAKFSITHMTLLTAEENSSTLRRPTPTNRTILQLQVVHQIKVDSPSLLQRLTIIHRHLLQHVIVQHILGVVGAAQFAAEDVVRHLLVDAVGDFVEAHVHAASGDAFEVFYDYAAEVDEESGVDVEASAGNTSV